MQMQVSYVFLFVFNLNSLLIHAVYQEVEQQAASGHLIFFVFYFLQG